MVTLWIGDFRTKQLQNTFKAAQQATEYYFLTDESADFVWFKDSVINQLPNLSLDSANVIINLGFIDCVYSCIWDSFVIENIADQYINEINNLIEEYSNFNFYICSVNPITKDYCFAGNNITKNILTNKIETFNTKIRNNCNATFIDSYQYLIDTHFTTRDGVYFTSTTCNALHNYIKNNINYSYSAYFNPRLIAPDETVDSYTYWDEAINPLTKISDNAAYAWGRFYEIIGEAPKLSTGLANTWYEYNDGYLRGNVPKVGAIACWKSIETISLPSINIDGYVAVVEQVFEDGKITTSESTSESGWSLIDRTNTNNIWGMDSSKYEFQGFIYCPVVSTISKELLCTKNSYNITLDEMKPNAQYIYQYLSAKGWTLNAVAGLLGNAQVESKMSPYMWQGTIQGSIINSDGTHTLNTSVLSGKNPGYGLVQWTPYTKYTDWCDQNNLNYWDINSQLQRICWEAENNKQWQAKPSKGYDLSFEEFISSTKNVSWLAEAFAFCYEQPASSTGTSAQQNALKDERGANGEYWYNYLSSIQLETNSTVQKIGSFKIDSCLQTEVVFSFLVKGNNTITWRLSRADASIKTDTVIVTDSYKVINIKNLDPNTEYLITLTTDGGIIRELSFKTLQETEQTEELNESFNTGLNKSISLYLNK